MRKIVSTTHVGKRGEHMPEVEFSDEQIQLLTAIFEASKAERREFYAIRHSGGAFIMHPGLPKSDYEVYAPDLQALFDYNLLTVTHYDSRSGDPSSFDISPLGRHVYNVAHSQTTPEAAIEADVRQFIDAGPFRSRYSAAYARWSSAAELLWSEDSGDHATDIGHRCREALQEFADILCEGMTIQNDSRKPETVTRLRAVLTSAAESLGDATKEMLDALLVYWGTVSDLAQRQEHGASRDKAPLEWEDSRRLVFQTLLVMYEIDRAVGEC